MSQQLPFYKIFDAFRCNGFPLGIDEYKDFVDVLCSCNLYIPTESIISREELLDICKTLWLKPNQVPFVFEKIFQHYYDEIFSQQKKKNSKEDEQESIPQEMPGKDPAGKSIDEQAKKPEPVVETPEAQALVNRSPKMELSRFKLLLNGGQEGLQHLRKEGDPQAERLFLFSDNYFPVSSRDIQQLFSGLPERKQRKGNIEIDIDLTIQSIVKNGCLAEIINQKEEEIVNYLLVLHDHNGSMVAFEKLSDIITEASSAIFRKNRQKEGITNTYYFQNATNDVIYLNKAHTSYIEMKLFVNFFREKKVLIIIVSDGGAARNSNSSTRVKAVIRMLRQLENISTKIVWLNPMPVLRWERSAAARIANFVPMFPVTQSGIMDAIEVLKGKHLKIDE